VGCNVSSGRRGLLCCDRSVLAVRLTYGGRVGHFWTAKQLPQVKWRLNRKLNATDNLKSCWVLTSKLRVVMVRGDVEWWGSGLRLAALRGPWQLPPNTASAALWLGPLGGRRISSRVGPRDTPQVDHDRIVGHWQLPEEETDSYVNREIGILPPALQLSSHTQKAGINQLFHQRFCSPLTQTSDSRINFAQWSVSPSTESGPGSW
jgi:hypothetical protein